MNIKKSFSIPIIVFSLSFLGGFIHASINIIVEKYIYYSMFNLIIMNYTNIITHWIIIGLLIYLLTIFLNFVIRKIERKISSGNSSQKRKNKMKKYFLFLSVLAFLFLFIFLGYLMNKYFIPYGKLHTISLIADTVLALTLILIWFIIFKNKKLMKIADKLYAIKYLNIGAITFLIIFIFLHGFLFYNKKIKNNDPNVLLIIVDTLRADHTGCYGYFRNTTPYMDKLSEDGILFKNAISPAPWTSPAIASILTSRYPDLMGITHDPIIISKKQLFMAEILKDNYYKTKGIISHTFIGRDLHYHQGFDSFDQENAWGGHFSITSPSISQKAVDFINKNKKNKFFLFLHYFDPHFAYMLHDQYNYFPDYKGEVKSRMSTHVLRKNAPNYSENDLKYLRALYDSEISFTDYYIGKVINHLKALNLYNNTIIIFTADHGESFSDHLCWIGHTKSLYQELIHVPLIIKPAEKNEHMKVNKYTGTIDILPTILSTLQIKKPKNINFNGTEIDLTDINKIENRVIISDTKRMSLLESVISDRYKVIKGKLWDYYKPSEHTYEIYDLRNDPLEKHNLYPGIDNDDIHDLKLILEEWNTYVHSKQSEIGKVKSPQLSKKERERLRSLGYM